ncbi:hypothetical protein HYY74_05170 [Candidatus Woesearchaeota archaeon]|nr:hypothetical protein [Candidatus Woesearchaeota archaeon]
MMKVMIDLDVVTVAAWGKSGQDTQSARRFLGRVANGEFEVYTPFFLFELLSKWNYTALVEEIKDFYIKNTATFLTNEEIDARFTDNGIDDARILLELEKNGVKDEDAFLVLVASAFNLSLITFNRKHLKNKKERINEVLVINGLSTTEIIGPEEI